LQLTSHFRPHSVPCQLCCLSVGNP
jgi:hypothetical protein